VFLCVIFVSLWFQPFIHHRGTKITQRNTARPSRNFSEDGKPVAP